MADDVDDLLRRAMATLDRETPAGYFDELPQRTLARLDAPAVDDPGDELARERAARTARAAPPGERTATGAPDARPPGRRWRVAFALAGTGLAAAVVLVLFSATRKRAADDGAGEYSARAAPSAPTGAGIHAQDKPAAAEELTTGTRHQLPESQGSGRWQQGRLSAALAFDSERGHGVVRHARRHGAVVGRGPRGQGGAAVRRDARRGLRRARREVTHVSVVERLAADLPLPAPRGGADARRRRTGHATMK
jgi:hypothetical protein